MREQIKRSVFYPYPPDKVWQALTDCRILNAWMMKNDFEPSIGHKFKFESNSLPGIETIIHCEVVELEKPKRLAYTWQDNVTGEASLVIWTLTPVEGGTRLQLKHQQAGYATTLVCNQNRNSREISDRPSLFLDEQPVTKFNQQMLQTSLHQRMTRGELSFLPNHRDSKEEWDYRLNHKLLQTLQRYC
ncbi:conserved hypothetical protein [Hyella patelloides LEGE 07179]|uniref:Activator of Hsp90 ATPase homologue 1/2-like C-terminal domain-containing protein n=1 Tax=Hyella patelloides LEGE 07179 TaxID=945734 RepID=A0A563VY05_9CYAN|nr:SRPBCC domain-containing protein [Hyella patelloides]VEP16338.1 conserved hypothetical protein [Hyella patelloides LEGE 07179]